MYLDAGGQGVFLFNSASEEMGQAAWGRAPVTLLLSRHLQLQIVRRRGRMEYPQLESSFDTQDYVSLVPLLGCTWHS